MSSRLLNSTPFEDNFIMPAEFEPQDAVWLCLAGTYGAWPNGGHQARQNQLNLVKAINKAGTHVNLITSNALFLEAEYLFADCDISIYDVTNTDCWMRDYGAIYVKNHKTGEVRGVDFKFNCWGGEFGGAYLDFANDDLIARKMLHINGYDRYKTSYVLEGGSITVDGEGTLITTESCLLNHNRNPKLDRADIEESLKNYLGITKTIWLHEGIDCEMGETDGHVDDLCAFIGPAEVVVCYTDDTTHPFYQIFKDCYDVLVNATDAKGRKLKVHKIPAASYAELTADEANSSICCQTTDGSPDGKWRLEGERLVPSYANFLISNGSIIFPVYNLDSDEEAVRCIREIVGDRYNVIPVEMRAIIVGGGSIHCITMQQPK